MTDMVEMVIDSIRVSLVSQQQVILLRERRANRYLPIWIGAFEANAIQLALHEVELSRPMTHDLMRNLLDTLGARLERVEIVALKENTFYGNLVISHAGRLHYVDARPSDAIALAVRVHVPIYAAREVIAEAGIVPDEAIDEQNEGVSAPMPPPAEGSQPSKQPSVGAPQPSQPTEAETAEDMDARLSVFASFFEQIADDQPDEEDDLSEGQTHDDE